MTRLVDDLIPKVITFLDLKESHSLCSTHKNYLQVGNQHLKQLIQDKKKWVTKWFPDVIHDLMSGLTTLIFAPILPFQNHFIGLDYIDGIRSSDVWSPIMVGIDDCQRPFITIRSCRIRINTDSHLKASVFTIFQRYTNSQEIWTHGSCYHEDIIGDFCPRIINGGTLQADLLKENIKNLLQQKNYIKYIKREWKQEDLITEIPTRLC